MVAIIAILATIAVPSYQSAILKVKRAEGRTALLKRMQQQEQFYSQRMTYVAFSAYATDPEAQRFGWFSGETAATSAYEISATACAGMRLADCVLISAIPGTGLVNAGFVDARCGTLRIDSLGRRSADSPGCW
ncbi:hypothetical protein GCM10022212_32610 [Actimicrobium antarcticum]|uniref:Pilus assembly protein PilE n=1 Tax=Actimicrobium antarcticum TaxID=1051899 RepID=A0ABP7TUE5_9BURK